MPVLLTVCIDIKSLEFREGKAETGVK